MRAEKFLRFQKKWSAFKRIKGNTKTILNISSNDLTFPITQSELKRKGLVDLEKAFSNNPQRYETAQSSYSKFGTSGAFLAL